MTKTNHSVHLPIESIKVPPDRHRSFLGDLDSLAESIARLGVLHPIVVSRDHQLVAGGRRLAALQKMGKKDVPVVVIENLDGAVERLLAERDENTCRLDLRPSEMWSIGRALEELEAPKAAQRQREAGKHGSKGGRGKKNPSRNRRRGFRDKTCEKVAAGLGTSGRTYEKLRSVCKAAENEPDKYDAIRQEMDESGNVDRAHKELKKLQKREAEEAIIATLPPASDRWELHLGDFVDVCRKLPEHSVNVICTDPPYGRQYVPLYGKLAEEAARLLKPGGSLVVMSGQSYMIEIAAAMAAHLNYRWCLTYLCRGGKAPQIWDRRIITTWKPILWFTSGQHVGDWIGDVVHSDVNDNSGQDHHHWGQSLSGISRLVDLCSKPGDLVCDPFVGAGSTGVACLQSGRRFIGIDCDKDALETTRRRLILAGQDLWQ